MRRLPSVKTLEIAFPSKGKLLRQALEMTKAQLKRHPAGAQRWAECHHPPACYDLRLHVLDSIAETHGVEYIASPEDTFTNSLGIDFLNTGDSYALTIVRSAETGNYRVASWGDLVEKWS